MPDASEPRALHVVAKHAHALAALLLLGYFALAVSASTTRSFTFDEPYHLTAGYLYWTHPEVPQAPGNGMFAQAWISLPLLALDVPLPPLDLTRATIFYIGYELGRSPATPLPLALFCARSMTALLAVLLGLLVYRWSSELWGRVGGLVSLSAYALCPTLLAHGALATTDLAAALGFTAATYAWTRVIERITPLRVLASLLAAALLVATKVSSVLLAPIVCAIALIQLASRRPIEVALRSPRRLERRTARALAIGALALAHVIVLCACIWWVYDVAYDPGDAPAQRAQRLAEDWGRPRVTALVLELAGRWGLLPMAFVDGMSGQLFITEMRRAFAAGEHTVHGFRWFFPYAFAIKTPLGTLALLALAALAFAAKLRAALRAEGPTTDEARALPYAVSPLLVLLGVYGAASIASNMNIGHRHILPLYPALYVLAGAAAGFLTRKRRVLAALVLASLLALAVASLSVRPYYLAFFNRLVGGPAQGYRHLVDSSLDWGQDLPGLARWLAEHHPDPGHHVALSYFGTGAPERYRIRARLLPSFFAPTPPSYAPFEPGTYCVSATMLQSVYADFHGPWIAMYEELYQRARKDLARFERSAPDSAEGEQYFATLPGLLTQLRYARLLGYLRARKPDAHVGWSILIFELSARDLARALDGPPAELRPPAPGLLLRRGR